ncbi:MAG: hypothetical protein J1E38_03615 [Paramuribaculum sp.]|nr:hypothetical protein [Paramuribaculum sp.]
MLNLSNLAISNKSEIKMKERIKQLIDFRTGGNRSRFAELMGWTPQYLNLMLKGSGGIGLKPIVTILERMPDVNARWLIMGEGAMLMSCIEETKLKLMRMLCFERYMSVMTEDELRRYSEGDVNFDLSSMIKWEEKLGSRS